MTRAVVVFSVSMGKGSAELQVPPLRYAPVGMTS
jgi:hypothetical protein